MKLKIVLLVFGLMELMLSILDCKNPTTPESPQVSEIDINVVYERVYSVHPTGIEGGYIYFEILPIAPGSIWIYNSAKLIKQEDGKYTARLEKVPTNSRCIVYVTDSMIFPPPLRGTIGKKIYLNGHECKNIVGDFGSEKARIAISSSGNISDL